MPLCPQITNTPVTVTQTGDFVVTSVVPLIADTTDGLANNFESIEILADGKTKVYRQNDEPTGAGINDGDLWIDINDGNKLYVRVSGAWVTAQDAAIGTAQAAANAAAAAAATAQANATTALADAAIAYTTAQNSLQGSAYAIQDPTTKQLTSIDSTGLTVYSGASATSGPRIVMNSLGIAAYGSGSSVNITNAVGNGTTVTYTASGHSFTVGKNITVSGLAPAGYNGAFVITAVSAGSTFTVANTTTATLTDANGVAEFATLAISATTGNAVFSGSVTGSTIIGGTLNIAGKAIIDPAGLLTATGATITGRINAEAGYFGTPTNGFDISTTGLVGVGNGVISGGAISGTTFTNGSTFNVTSGGVLTATSGTIGGWSMTSSTLFRTVGTKTLTLDSAGPSITLSDSGSGFSTTGIIITSSGQTAAYGATQVALSGSAANIDFAGLGSLGVLSNNILLQSGGTQQIILKPGSGLGSTTYNVEVQGYLSIPVYAFSTGTYSTSSTSQTEGVYISASGAIIGRRDNAIPLFSHRWNASGTSEVVRFVYNGSDAGGINTSSGGSPAFRTTSDYRLKQDIADFDGSVNIIKATRLRSFRMKHDPENMQIGFVAHEFSEAAPELVMGQKDALDEDGNPDYQSIMITSLIPYLTGALKDVILRVEALEGE
jgi:hypothetical protein